MSRWDAHAIASSSSVEVVARANERQRLERLRRGAHEADELRVAGARDDLAVAHRDGVDAVPRLDDSAPAHLDDDRLDHEQNHMRTCEWSGFVVCSADADHDGHDYEAADTLVVADPKQLKAMADPLRTQLIELLRDRARSTQEIAEELGIPKGTVGHHLKVLEAAGLIRVVRTRKVRAVTEKFYGRTARLFLYQAEDPPRRPRDLVDVLRTRPARSSAPRSPQASVSSGRGSPKKDVARFERRAKKLMDDFRAADTPGGRSWSDWPRASGAQRQTMRRLAPSGALWQHPDFLKLWAGQTISEFGSQVSQLAIPLLAVLDAEGDAVPVRAARDVLDFLPFILFTLPAGSGSTGWRRRWILIVGDAARAVLLALDPGRSTRSAT